MAHQPTFKDVLLDVQRSRLSEEIVAIRYGLLAPQVILLHGQRISEALTQMSQELSDAVDGQEGLETTETYKLFEYIEGYVNETAYGEAALRFRGHVPQLAQPVKGSVTAALRASSKVELQSIRDALGTAALEAARKGDEKSADDVALRLQKQIEELSMQFYTISSQVFEDMNFPADKFNDLPLEATASLVDSIPPLEKPEQEEAERSTSPDSTSLLDRYHARGVGIRYVLSEHLRAAAKEAFAKASKQRGEAQVKSYDTACHCFHVAASYLGCADIAYSNMSAIALLLKRYTHGIFYADKALHALEERLTYPQTYKAKRATAVIRLQFFKTGDQSQAVRHPRLPRTEEEVKVDNGIAWKATYRKARAYAGLCMETLNKTQGAINEADRDLAQSLYGETVKIFKATLELNKSDTTPLKDLEAFEREKAARLAAA